MSTATEMATTKKRELRVLIESDDFKGRIASVLPKHLKPERMAKIALGAIARTPGLTKCTPESFLLCMLQLSQWGLEPDGRRAHLIPYGNNCTLIIDYKGMAELVVRSGLVSVIHADVIRPGDTFEYAMGELHNHVPHWMRTDSNKPKDAGDPIGAFCRIVMKDGAKVCHVMSKAEILKAKAVSQSSGGSSSPWQKWPDEMWKKTVFKRAAKWLPWSAEIRDAIDTDDAYDRGADQPAAAPKLTTSEFAGLLDAPEDEPPTIEGDATETQSDKQPGDLAASKRIIGGATTKAEAMKSYEAEVAGFEWTEQQDLELEAFTSEHKSQLKK